jgi:TetR/AcrR family transcriptional repressor of mexJK operon
MYSLFCRPKEALRRAAILQVAREVFSEVGYAATSMSQIASRLGGSKATLYKYFPSKEELFAASLEDLIGSHIEDMPLPAPTREDLVKTLANICRKITAAGVSPPFLSLCRLVVAESPRFPEVGRAYYDKVVLPGTQRIANFLQACMDKGLIKRVDPMLAASQLLALCRSNCHFRALANPAEPPSSAEIAADAEAAVTTFLAAFQLA